MVQHFVVMFAVVSKLNKKPFSNSLRLNRTLFLSRAWQ
jgi:hypothetical protein